MNTSSEPPQGHPLVVAYHRMMERVKLRLEALEQAEQEALPQLRASIEHAAEKAVELGELSREEARLIGGYLKRDWEDAGHYLTTTGRDLRDWLRFDAGLLEDRLLDFFQRGVDQSRLELLAFTVAGEHGELLEYHSGEVTGPGALQCAACGEALIFHVPTLIPPCPTCAGLAFVRLSDES